MQRPDARFRHPRPVALLALAALLLAGPARGQGGPTRFDAIGLIDYDRPPDFRVGTWVKYRVTGQSDLGMRDDYTITVTIGGEEEFWGDPCFWIETRIDDLVKGPSATATLMSYDAFKDSLGFQKMQYYMRKTVTGLTEKGELNVQILKIPKGKLKTPRTEAPPHLARDTLGVDSVVVPKGTFEVSMFRFRQGYATTEDRGDSTIRETFMEKRTVHVTRVVPITHLAKEIIDVSGTRQAWLIGQSSRAAPETIRDKAVGEAVLVGFGEGGEAGLVPPKFRKSLADQKREAAAAARGAAKPGAAKPEATKPAGGSGRSATPPKKGGS